MTRYADTVRRLPLLLLVFATGIASGMGLFGTAVNVGHLIAAVSAYCLLAAIVTWLRPGSAPWLWGRSPTSSMLAAVAFACGAADTLYDVPRPEGYALVVVGLGTLAASIWLGRGAHTSGGVQEGGGG